MPSPVATAPAPTEARPLDAATAFPAGGAALPARIAEMGHLVVLLRSELLRRQ